jgi:hypothetical protein
MTFKRQVPIINKLVIGNTIMEEVNTLSITLSTLLQGGTF